MDYNVNYRKKDKGIQAIVSYKVGNKWKQKSKQGFEDSRLGKRKAKEWVENTIQELKELDTSNIDMMDITFKDFYNMYISDHKANLSPNSLVGYNYAFNSVKDLHKLEISKIKKIDIQRIFDNLKLSANSKNTLLARIKCMFNSAINEYEIINKNPCVSIKLEKTKTREKRALTQDELKDLLSKLKTNKTIRAYITSVLASKCGLRLGEILGLTWDKIDFKNREITIDKQWNILDKKNNIYGFKKLKTNNSYRTIPVSASVIEILKEYKNNYPISITGRLINIKSSNSYSNVLIKIYRRMGYDISVHELRHTYTTNLIANGIDFKTAAMLIGDTVDMVMKVYSHVNKDMMNKARDIINNF
ncbi:MAG: tyrosine-type recombinase/integrase [Inconstantimicrobium porci]|uniref:tyrosine-type recombinase/integrase n=1 Tax=Inconstantimicrobium porci TaxID=2652291 RepID=UPI002A90FBD0|nr:tyrosine-type recombinase/integrase [Inconstantimicrobium porci]MDY5910596.1 tyrosine-type recombinase/integrase [Inconstantimicrobium porci]